MPAFGRIVETTQGRPWDLEGTPSPAPQRLLIGRRGSQGPSVRPDSIAYFEYHMHVIPAGKGLNHPNGKGQAPAFGRIVETTQAREAWGPRGDTQSRSRSPGALDWCAGVTGDVGTARNITQCP